MSLKTAAQFKNDAIEEAEKKTVEIIREEVTNLIKAEIRKGSDEAEYFNYSTVNREALQTVINELMVLGYYTDLKVNPIAYLLVIKW
ncbi:hypothetical protein HUN13_01090 [Acinetobacter seifertii]|uniref:hypothetical protein n=1 Tax=Acinetobacter seifertii TaxID=1530123 RepID=UPI00157FE533|nr:hypothetical protein [Acinetobacter seifertii]NUG10176.1 hypothetical protein [Acinetobacter seifertii]